MPLLQDEVLAALTHREQQTAQSGADVSTPASGSLQAPGTMTQGEQNGLSRAAQAVSNLKSTGSLESSLGVAPPPTTVVPPPADTKPVSSNFQPPTGTPDQPSIPVLGGVLDLLDTAGKALLAPAFVGRHVDPNTGIAYKYTDLIDEGHTLKPLSGLADIAPGFAIFDMFDPARQASRAKFEQEYGQSMLDQAGQVFMYKNTSDAFQTAMSPEGRQAWRLLEEIIKVPAGLALSTVDTLLNPGKAAGHMVYELVSGNRSVQESIAQLPSYSEGYVKNLREAYFAAGTDPKQGSKLAEVITSLGDPGQLALGALPIGNIAKYGLGKIGDTPIVGNLAKVSIGKFKNFSGTLINPVASHLLEFTPSAKGAQAAARVHDTLGALWQSTGAEEHTAASFIKTVRQFVQDDEYAAKLAPYFTNADEAKQARDILQYVRKGKTGNILEDRWQNLEGILRPMELHNAPSELIATVVGAEAGDAVRASLYVPGAKASLGEKLVRLVEKGTGRFADYWRPLVLDTRMTYLLNNVGVGVTSGLQRYGGAFLDGSGDAMLVRNGLLSPVEEARGALGMLKPNPSAGGAFSEYSVAGFSPAGTSRELPDWLKKIPGLGRYTNAIHEASGFSEAQLHRMSQRALLRPMQQAAVDKLVAALPEDIQPLFKGIGGEVDAAQRIKELASDAPRLEHFIPYGDMTPRASEYMAQAIRRIGNSKAALSEQDINTAWDEARQLMTRDSLYQKLTQDDEALANMVESEVTGAYSHPNKEATFKATSELDAQQEELSHIAGDLQKQVIRQGPGRAANSTSLVYPKGVETELQKDYARATNRLQPLDNQLGIIRSNYASQRQTLWQDAWNFDKALKEKTHFRLREDPRFEAERTQLEQKFNDTWDAVRQLIGKTKVQNENAVNIYAHAQIENWDEARLSQTLKDWLGRGDASYTVPSKVADAITAARGRYHGTRAGAVGGLAPVQFNELARMAGFTDKEIPGVFPKASQVIDESLMKDIGSINDARAQFGRAKEQMQNWRMDMGFGGGQVGGVSNVTPDVTTYLTQKLGRDPNDLLSEIRDFSYRNRDESRRVAELTQMNYMEDQRVFDRYMKLLFPFSFFNTRYMLFQMREASRDPRQTFYLLKTLKAWSDQNADRPFWDKFSVSLTTVNPGTPQQAEVRFNPAFMLFPMAGSVGDVVSAADPAVGDSLSQGLYKVANFLGGGTWPWVPALASHFGMDLEGGPPKSLGDMIKGLVPPATWARQGIAAIPGMEDKTLGVLTRREIDGVVRDIQQAANTGQIPLDDAKKAAASLEQGSPDALAQQFLQKNSGARLGGSLTRAQAGPFSSEDVGQQSVSNAYAALKEARTEVGRQAIYENNPGLEVNLSGKDGAALQLGIINAQAPTNPILRSVYYQQKHAEIAGLTAQRDAEQGNQAPDYKMYAATPESFHAFRLAGGASLVPGLVDFWTKGTPLSRSDEEKLASLYKPYGMGSLSYDEWKNHVLPDAYRQWLLQNRTQLDRMGTGIKVALGQ